MTAFRHDDYVSMQVLFLAVISAIVLLTLAYIILKIFQKKIVYRNRIENKDSIHVLESKHIPNLGYLFLLSIDGKRFLALNSKFGIKMTQIREEHESSRIMDDEEVDQ